LIDNPDNSKRLQLLIHCYGKAREAIESCVNLPVEEGYYVAKSTLLVNENFDKPHIIAKAHQETREFTSSKASRWTKPSRVCKALGRC